MTPFVALPAASARRPMCGLRQRQKTVTIALPERSGVVSVALEGAEVGGMTTIVHGLDSDLAAVRVNWALSSVTVDPNPTFGGTPDGHLRSDQIASAVKSKERT